MKNILTLSILAFLFSACTNESSKIAENQTLYYGGDIVTMSGNEPNYVESIVTNADSIIFTGHLSEAKRLFPSAKN